jgi:MFS family permease
VTVGQGTSRGHGRVPSRAAAWLAWVLGVVCVALGVLGLLYGARNDHSLVTTLTDLGPIAVLAVSFPVVGALIASYRPGNPLGWILCAIGFSEGLATFGGAYGTYALRTASGTMPGGSLAIWVGQWAWAPGAGLLATFLPLLFPDGRLPSRRWRPVAWLSAIPIVLISGVLAVRLWPLRGPALVDTSAEAPLGEPLGTVVLGSFLLMLGCGLACLAALAVRFRRARGIERQQLKWFLFACAITVPALVASQEVRLLSLPLFLAVPVAAGVAILRYRLYDIDRLISRTVSYGLLTGVLGLGYAGVVLLLGDLFGGVAREPPSWAIAGATLAVAALFRPARRRIQAAVDRRFNRRKYNTAKTIQAFSTRLREQIDLDELTTELLAVVDQTMEPTRVSFWLRPSPPGSSAPLCSEGRPTPWAY